MKQQIRLHPLIILALLFSSCATILPGNDPVVVNAERSTQIAVDTFNTIEKLEYDTYPAFKQANPSAAASVRKFVNNLRVHQSEWLESARTMTKAYKGNRSAENKANLTTAISVLTSATSEANRYILELNSTKAP